MRGLQRNNRNTEMQKKKNQNANTHRNELFDNTSHISDFVQDIVRKNESD